MLSPVGEPFTPAVPLLRPAEAADVSALMALDVACFGSRAWPKRAWLSTVLDSGWTTLVAHQGGDLVGALVVVPRRPVASLASIAVHPLHRRRKLGRFLLSEALRIARLSGARWISLEVDAHNHAAVLLYRREGFHVLRRFSEEGRRRLEMVRRLGGRHGS